MNWAAKPEWPYVAPPRTGFRPEDFSCISLAGEQRCRAYGHPAGLQTYAAAFDRSMDVLVGRLHAKFEHDPKHPTLILTVCGAGYKFASPVRLEGGGLAW
jgi:hypothetical protein